MIQLRIATALLYAGVLACRPAGPKCSTCAVIEAVTIIDGTGAAPLVGQSVLIEGDRIKEIRPTGQLVRPAGATVVDGRGKYLIPGLIETHAHVADQADSARSAEMLRTLLAMGITTVLSPGGSTGHSVALREAVAAGRVVGPRLFVAGDIIDAAPGLFSERGANTPALVAGEVERQAKAGVDFVKLYRVLDAPLTAAGVAAAHQSGIRGIAHTSATSWLDAARAGIDILVHAGPGISSLLTPAQRAEYVRVGQARPSALGVLARRFYAPFALVDLDAARPGLDTLIEALNAHRVAVDPTLVIYEAMFWANDSMYRYNPDLSLVPDSVVSQWRREGVTTSWAPADYDSGRAVFPKALRFVKLLHEGGVLLTAGTDTPVPLVVPGASYHRNLVLLHQAGLTPLEVLRIATLNGARALKIDGETGSIAVGKQADLVLLSADPTASIANTRRIDWVMKGGKLRRSADLLARQ